MTTNHQALSTDLAPTPSTTPPETWTVQHLSPLSVFQPDRIDICTEYRLALLDGASTQAKAHLDAALRHLREALRQGGLTHRGHRDVMSDLDHVRNELAAAINRLA